MCTLYMYCVVNVVKLNGTNSHLYFRFLSRSQHLSVCRSGSGKNSNDLQSNSNKIQQIANRNICDNVFHSHNHTPSWYRKMLLLLLRLLPLRPLLYPHSYKRMQIAVYIQIIQLNSVLNYFHLRQRYNDNEKLLIYQPLEYVSCIFVNKNQWQPVFTFFFFTSF